MKTSKLLIGIVTLCLFSLNSLCFADDTKKTDSVASSVAAEVSAAKAKMEAEKAKKDGDVVAVVKAILASCSKEAVVGIAKAAAALCPSSSFASLYATAVAKNSNEAAQLAGIFKITGATGASGGGGISGGAGGIKGVITGQRNDNTEKKASP